MPATLTAPERDSAYRWGASVLVAAIAIILTALGFEYIGGYRPCPLCLQQRYAYYAGIPVLFGALVLVTAGQRRWAGLLFAIVAAGFLVNAGLGVYHAGVEWKFGPAPTPASFISIRAGRLWRRPGATQDCPSSLR